eukprot:TRINITY_DN1054_c0_g1_i1.p1 TRINITY_DN1054_c0_g1~~TRINITY_DN1054_c0_g1_i1.p1  ORF type:complete len:244 (-),score=24.13 TRINITY_DN1054_c0_g1_i1:552-1247(-)
MNHIERLPTELSLLVLAYLDVAQLKQMRLVNSEVKSLIDAHIFKFTHYQLSAVSSSQRSYLMVRTLDGGIYSVDLSSPEKVGRGRILKHLNEYDNKDLKPTNTRERVQKKKPGAIKLETKTSKKIHITSVMYSFSRAMALSEKGDIYTTNGHSLHLSSRNLGGRRVMKLCGGHESIFIRLEDSTWMCWGYNPCGKLGISESHMNIESPTEFSDATTLQLEHIESGCQAPFE